jgi:hypothetical protein
MFRKRARWYIENKPGVSEFLHVRPDNQRQGLISLVGKSRLRQILARMLDEAEFLSPYGLRSLSRYHREHPLIVNMDGPLSPVSTMSQANPGPDCSAAIRTGADRSGFRLIFSPIESLRHLHTSFGEDFTVELPTGSGRQAKPRTSGRRARAPTAQIVLRDADGRRPALGSNLRFQRDGAWRDALLFYEYFHGDTGEGLGASHQTGVDGSGRCARG